MVSVARGRSPVKHARVDAKHPKASSEDKAKVDKKLIATFKKLRKFAQDQHPCPIAPGLFIGSIGAAQNLEELKKAGITHILNACPLAPCFYQKDFEYLHVQVFDDSKEDIAQHFACTNTFIEQGLRQGGVLVHCYAGISRSATFLLAYMISNLGMDVAQALCLLRCSRPQANPNSGFLTQLEAHRDEERRQCERQRANQPSSSEMLNEASGIAEASVVHLCDGEIIDLTAL